VVVFCCQEVFPLRLLFKLLAPKSNCVLLAFATAVVVIPFLEVKLASFQFHVPLTTAVYPMAISDQKSNGGGGEVLYACPLYWHYKSFFGV